jgi:hypothetical protein
MVGSGIASTAAGSAASPEEANAAVPPGKPIAVKRNMLAMIKFVKTVRVLMLQILHLSKLNIRLIEI